MVYVFGVTLPNNQQVKYALPRIFGIGYKRALEICNTLGISYKCTVSQLNDFQISKICKIIEQSYSFENDLRKEIYDNVHRLNDIGCYRGYRHSYGLPVRGQRTHTNNKTQKRLSRRFKKN